MPWLKVRLQRNSNNRTSNKKSGQTKILEKNKKKSEKVLTDVRKCCIIDKQLFISDCFYNSHELWAISSGGRALDF